MQNSGWMGIYFTVILWAALSIYKLSLGYVSDTVIMA